MLKLAEDYAKSHNIAFSTDPNPKKSKTKGIIFKQGKKAIIPENIKLCGNPLPWIDGAKYLGNYLTDEINGLNEDVKQKRAKYIERNCEIIQEFYFAHPEVKTKINRIYNTSYTGSVLWDLGSENVRKLINSWSVSVRLMWNLPRQAHTELIEPLSGTHAKTMLYSRFVQFIQSIQKSSKSAAHFLLELIKNNKETVTGRNIDIILRQTDENDIMTIKAKQLKNKMVFKELPVENKWKIDIIKELTNVKQNNLVIEFTDENEKLTRKEMQAMIDLAATV